ncbi:secretion system protein [Bacillus sp. DNRA2]|uniref:type II secretion system F family protein n=1 Tax=Bacillus sp. DNRA2 TaxID=2723053 RepID=UPI00145C6224|nr:type II secretion system F family protein [Bacillus sp. DNRA2]NMD70123.1 secretion system protein [Bacillus sp. DNRA2]
MLWLLFIALSVLFGSLGMLLLQPKRSLVDRLEKFFPKDAPPESRDQQQEQHQQRRRILNVTELKSILTKLSKNFTTKKNTTKWETKLEAANLPLKTEEFQALRIVTGLAAVGITALLKLPIPVIIVAAIIGPTLPTIYLKRKIKTRLARCTTQLPQALGTMATSMKSGYSFLQAMQVIAQEVPDPIGTEFKKTLREINLGVPLEEAFANLINRLPTDDIKIVANAIIIQRSTGGNLTQILDTIQETITDRVRIKEELRALTAQGKMSAWIISLLPVIIGVVLNLMNPEYFNPMISHPLGWTLLGAGLISGIIGWFVIQKIVNIEV